MWRGLLSYRSRVFVLHEKTIIIITFKGKLYKINSGKKGLLGLHRNVRLPLSQEGGEKRKRNTSM